METGLNSFRLVGKVVGYSEGVYNKGLKVTFTLSVNERLTGRYIPFDVETYGKVAEKAKLLARDGALIAVNGYISSIEHYTTDSVVIRHTFVGLDVMLLKRGRKKDAIRTFKETMRIYEG